MLVANIKIEKPLKYQRRLGLRSAPLTHSLTGITDFRFRDSNSKVPIVSLFFSTSSLQQASVAYTAGLCLT